MTLVDEGIADGELIQVEWTQLIYAGLGRQCLLLSLRAYDEAGRRGTIP